MLPRGSNRALRGLLALPLALLAGLALVSCGGDSPPARPNILWILWDTVRADRLGLYGHDRPTTPFLDAWARDARVYDDCISAANYTVPAHASFFTGLLTSQHGADNDHLRLAGELVTIAELLRDAGYETYLYSANPHISAEEDFAQGFSAADHPWSESLRRAALEILREKIDPGDRTSALAEKVRLGRVGKWDIKASGRLTERALRGWLAQRDGEKPWFAFLNYMEAHRPYIPPREYRERMMTPAEVERSYEIDRSWGSQWSYTFGQAEYTPDELALTAATYDAAVAELDDLLRELLGALEKDGRLRNTIVVVTSDHGEHLGDHHMIGHQHSLYNALIRVPLVIRYPERFPPGRDARPVVNYDLFPTLLELAGLPVPDLAGSGAVSLLAPAPAGRVRVAESLGVFRDPFPAVKQLHPAWDPAPWDRELRTVVAGPDKLIWSSNGAHQLYAYGGDPGEERDRAAAEPDRVAHLTALLESRLAQASPRAARVEAPAMTPEHRERLRSLGYIDVSARPDTAAAGE